MNVEALKREFDQVYTRPGVNGRVFTYIRPVQVMDRLDEAFGEAGWSVDYDLLYADDKVVAMRCRITANGQVVSGIGEADRTSTTEAFKAAASDSLKRAAVHLGIARYLYEEPPVEGGNGDMKRFPRRSIGEVWTDEKGEVRIMCPEHGAFWAMQTRTGTYKCKKRISDNAWCEFEAPGEPAPAAAAPAAAPKAENGAASQLVEAEYQKLLELQKQYGWRREHLAKAFGINEVNASLIKNTIASGMSADEINQMAIEEMGLE